jgi:flavin-dependent dehydrogenase
MPEAFLRDKKTIAIIGGGPAASATALSLMNSLSGPEAPRTSCCAVHIFCDDNHDCVRIGETIPPAATPILRRLNLQHLIEDNGDHLVCPGSISLWNSDIPGHNDFMLDVVGRGYHLDRQKFDRQLLSEAESAGVKVHRGWRLTGAREVDDRLQLDFSTAGNDDSAAGTAEPGNRVIANFAVDATGKPAAFARRLDVARNTFDEVLFLCGLFDLPENTDMLPLTFVEAVEHGWWYMARLPQNKMIVTFCTDAEAVKAHQWQSAERWLQLLQQTKWLQQNMPASILREPASALNIIIQAAPSAILSAVCGPSWLAVGDAASSYDPITSAGITKALAHGELAGSAIATWLAAGSPDGLKDYQARVFDDFNEYTRVRSLLYRSETRFPKSLFWQKRLGSI